MYAFVVVFNGMGSIERGFTCLVGASLSALIVQGADQVKNKSLRTLLANSTHRPLFAEPEWEYHSCSWQLYD